jgi:hypothetical protein
MHSLPFKSTGNEAMPHVGVEEDGAATTADAKRKPNIENA